MTPETILQMLHDFALRAYNAEEQARALAARVKAVEAERDSIAAKLAAVEADVTT